jgi:ribonuclease P protein component
VVKNITQSVDFERVLRTVSCARSVHFAVHFLPTNPTSKTPPKFSESAIALDQALQKQTFLGLVVPKRHAKRSVTRNLLKRQMRQVVRCWDQSLVNSVIQANDVGLPKGMWVIRLRSPFDQKKYFSAASNELRKIAEQELNSLVENALLRLSQ